MSHIHKKIDFVVCAYIIHKNKVLLVHHKESNKWLPIGGHIELDEDTDQALVREINEETGLTKYDIEFIENRPKIKSDAKFMLAPSYIDVHKINKIHKHIGLVYFVKAKTPNVKLASKEHFNIKWFSTPDLDKQVMPDNVQFYAKQALRTLSSNKK